MSSVEQETPAASSGSSSSDCFDYFPAPTGDTEAPASSSSLIEGLMTPIPFREEVASLQNNNNNNERILFQEAADDSLDGDQEYISTSPLLLVSSSSSQHHHRHHHHHHHRGATTTTTTASTTPALNGVNYLNVVTYVAHLFVSWGLGVWGLNHIIATRWDITTRYETLVTPAQWAYLIIWYPILVLEGIFALAQLFPYYRARPIVQAGTRFYFFYTFLIQTAWTLFFSFRLFIPSFIAVVAALVSLLSLLASQQASLVGGSVGSINIISGSKIIEYYLFCFPFYLHTGWMAVLTAQHFSLLFRFYGANVGLQLCVDIVALAVLLALAMVCLVSSPSSWPWRKDFVIPTVILYSYIAIAIRLHHPSDILMYLHGPIVIYAVRCACYFLAGTVGCCLIPNIVIWIFHEFCTINVVELD